MVLYTLITWDERFTKYKDSILQQNTLLKNKQNIMIINTLIKITRQLLINNCWKII